MSKIFLIPYFEKLSRYLLCLNSSNTTFILLNKHFWQLTFFQLRWSMIIDHTACSTEIYTFVQLEYFLMYTNLGISFYWCYVHGIMFFFMYIDLYLQGYRWRWSNAPCLENTGISQVHVNQVVFLIIVLQFSDDKDFVMDLMLLVCSII